MAEPGFSSRRDGLHETLARRGRPVAGFTLLEVLVVVALIAILGAALALAIGTRSDRALVTSAERVVALLDHAANAAIASGRVYGCYVTPHGIVLVEHDGHAWRTLPAGGVDAGLTLEAPYVLRGDGVRANSGGASNAPRMLFFPDGERDYAAIAVANTVSGEAWAIEPEAINRFALVPLEQQ